MVSETDSAAPQQGSRTGSKPASRIASKAGSRATSKASSKASSKVGSRINSKPGSAQPSENNSVAGDVASQHSQKKDQSGNTTSRGEEESAPNSPVIAGQKSVTIVEPEKEIPPASTSEGFMRMVLSVVVESHQGETEQGLYHGQGTARFKGGHSYEGEFYKGLMHGDGKYTWFDGTVYEGDFTNNQLTGTGKYTWVDGSFYEGAVLDGFRHGSGVYNNVRLGCTYNGQWVKGHREGQGTLTYDAKAHSYYTGSWVDGQRHGQGVIRYPSGSTYEGEWRNDKKAGVGTMTWTELNQSYTGEWEEDRPNGTGEYTWANVAGMRAVQTPEGPRTSHLQVLNRYKGQFNNGLRHGQGSFYYASGAEYHGSYSSNAKHGLGSYTFVNGTTYQGKFVEDKMANGQLWHEAQIHQYDLPISDLLQLAPLDGETTPPPLERSMQRELVLVKHVLMRFNSELLALYRRYSAPTTENGAGSDLRLQMRQLWRLLQDAGVLTPYLTQAEVSRIALFRLLHDPQHPTRALGDTPPGPQSVHDGQRGLLVREFLEVVVRLADHIFLKNNLYDDTGDDNLDEEHAREEAEQLAAAEQLTIQSIKAKEAYDELLLSKANMEAAAAEPASSAKEAPAKEKAGKADAKGKKTSAKGTEAPSKGKDKAGKAEAKSSAVDPASQVDAEAELKIYNEKLAAAKAVSDSLDAAVLRAYACLGLWPPTPKQARLLAYPNEVIEEEEAEEEEADSTENNTAASSVKASKTSSTAGKGTKSSAEEKDKGKEEKASEKTEKGDKTKSKDKGKGAAAEKGAEKDKDKDGDKDKPIDGESKGSEVPASAGEGADGGEGGLEDEKAEGSATDTNASTKLHLADFHNLRLSQSSIMLEDDEALTTPSAELSEAEQRKLSWNNPTGTLTSLSRCVKRFLEHFFVPLIHINPKPQRHQSSAVVAVLEQYRPQLSELYAQHSTSQRTRVLALSHNYQYLCPLDDSTMTLRSFLGVLSRCGAFERDFTLAQAARRLANRHSVGASLEQELVCDQFIDNIGLVAIAKLDALARVKQALSEPRAQTAAPTVSVPALDTAFLENGEEIAAPSLVDAGAESVDGELEVTTSAAAAASIDERAKSAGGVVNNATADPEIVAALESSAESRLIDSLRAKRSGTQVLQLVGDQGAQDAPLLKFDDIYQKAEEKQQAEELQQHLDCSEVEILCRRLLGLPSSAAV